MKVWAVRTNEDWEFACHLGDLSLVFGGNPSMAFDQCRSCGGSDFTGHSGQVRGGRRWFVTCDGCGRRFFPHKRDETLVAF